MNDLLHLLILIANIIIGLLIIGLNRRLDKFCDLSREDRIVKEMTRKIQEAQKNLPH